MFKLIFIFGFLFSYKEKNFFLINKIILCIFGSCELKTLLTSIFSLIQEISETKLQSFEDKNCNFAKKT